MSDDVTQNQSAEVPLCVDLDGTLIRTDLLWESVLANARVRPWVLLGLPLLLLKGRAPMKSALAKSADIDYATLPYRAEVLEMIQRSRREGRRVFLTTASTQQLACGVADALGLFDGVIASDSERNLKGQNKADVLIERFGRNGFDYVGDSAADRPIWNAARRAFVVGSLRHTADSGRGDRIVERLTDRRGSTATFNAVVKALRPHQWAKNLLVFVPLLAAHRTYEPAAIAATLLAFLAFCLCASSAYVLNDLLDLGADRAHPRKRERPFASGDLSPAIGMMLFPALLFFAACAAYLLPARFHLILATYFVVTLAYSTVLKRRVMIDVIALAGLYTARILGGGFAIDAPVSFWLLGFSMFIFLSLALVKRFTEFMVPDQTAGRRIAGRGYRIEDKPVVMGLGMASGMVGVLVLALYINSDAVSALYRSPSALWLMCPPLLYWIGRIWIIAGRGKMHDDPIVFAARDKMSYVVVALMASVVWLAT